MASLAATSQEHAAAIAALRTRLGNDLPEPGRADGVLLRFLVARDFDVSEAERMVRDHVTWRRLRFPIRRSYWCNDPTFLGGAVFPHGRDKAGRPILVVRSGRFCPDERDIEACAAGAVVQVVEMFRRNGGKHTRITVVYDRQGFSISQNLDKALLKVVVQTFQLNFPETLHQTLIYPCGMVLSGIWSAVQWFFDPEVRAKVLMLPDQASFSEYIDADQLIRDCGGTSNYTFDHAQFVQSYPEVCVDDWAEQGTGGGEGESKADNSSRGDAAGDAAMT